MYEAKLSNLAARIAMHADSAVALNEDEAIAWIERTRKELDNLRFEIEHNQNVEAIPRAAMVKTLEAVRKDVQGLE
jgi:hypothetical protein